ncbi:MULTISPECIES: hypothetical protein [unclassified Rhizobacter]|uniref:hypothetical protein n=1 Tax=unclassified Rhizobacter TaxID=2640088 RepID=UPI0006FF3430|nr:MULTISPECIES: hypothetical protein [unclassified Rhizobacter]KQU73358.1 hypothetical protein ASC88_03830 [Rhizobacter sp. Root29]KQV98543.1 hypothetical protein ASC98_07660 [Rhizobacter sp. Root1238]KRB04795.1 hypothetical protein ASE08_12815 [Rhizobacter sp. Root16D2]
MKAEPSKTPGPTGRRAAAAEPKARPDPAPGPWAGAIADTERMVAQRRELQAAFGAAYGPVVQRQWQRQDDGPTYTQDAPIDGRLWTVRLARRVGDDDLYRFDDGQATSDWLPAATHVRNGHPPPQGARFAEQRLADGRGPQGREGADKYVFESSTLATGTPLTIKQAHAALGRHVARIQEERRHDKDMLDVLLHAELKRIRDVLGVLTGALQNNTLNDVQSLALREHFAPDDVATMIRSRALNAKQAETLAAGLRYKRLYEHEQNLLTINRRSRSDIETALDEVAGKYDLDLEVDVDDDASTEAVSVRNFEHRDYDLGTFYFGAARFEQVSGPLVEGGSAVYRHRGTNKEYVEDIAGSFMPRFVSRAIRYEDALALLANQSMPTKLDPDASLSGKEARDYGPGFHEGQSIDYNQMVIGQIRGYGRFLSATSSKHMATSTSRGTYDSPYGKVEIDLARMGQNDYSEAHSEDAMQQTFGVDDLGAVEFVPKHLAGEQAKVKAARDAYRAREVVVDSPPVDAVRTVSRNTGEVGLVIVGVTGSADEDSVRASLGKWAAFVSFIEVNTDYKRDIDGHKGNTAFVFFKGVEAIEPVVAYLRSAIEGRRATKIQPEGFVKAVPGSTELNNYRNPEQASNRLADTTFLETCRSRRDAMLDELDKALLAAPARKVRLLVQGARQQLNQQWQRLERDADQGVDPTLFAAAAGEMLREGALRQSKVRAALDPTQQ